MLDSGDIDQSRWGFGFLKKFTSKNYHAALPATLAKTMKVTHAQAVQAGYGHKKITVELENGSGERKSFSATTNNMPDFDAANDLREDDIQGYYVALYHLIEYKIADQVDELENTTEE